MPSISAPVIGASVLAGGNVVSGLLGANASRSAANAQLQAAQLASNTQLGIFNQTQANLQPYNTAGQSALSQLAALFGLGPGGTGPNANTANFATSALTNYPGYKFGLQEGLQALGASSAAQGTYLSGSQLAAATQFGTNYAMQQAWNPYVSNLYQLASLGENAGAQQGTIGANTGNSIAQTQLAAGNAAASGIVGSNNAITSGLSSGLNNATLAYLLASKNGGIGTNDNPLG